MEDWNLITSCQQARRAKTRGWRSGSIIEPYEDNIQAIQISSVCKRCSVRIIQPIGGALRTASKLQPMKVRYKSMQRQAARFLSNQPMVWNVKFLTRKHFIFFKIFNHNLCRCDKNLRSFCLARWHLAIATTIIITYLQSV